MRYCKEKNGSQFIFVRRNGSKTKQFWTGDGWTDDRAGAKTVGFKELRKLFRRPPG